MIDRASYLPMYRRCVGCECCWNVCSNGDVAFRVAVVLLIDILIVD